QVRRRWLSAGRTAPAVRLRDAPDPGRAGFRRGGGRRTNCREGHARELGGRSRGATASPGRPERWPGSPRGRSPFALRDVEGHVGALQQRVERGRRPIAPAVGDDAERLDEALPAARKRDRHAEVENLLVTEV